MSEVCENPFRKRKCENIDIQLYIIYKDHKLPVCRKCWFQLSKGRYKDKEWGPAKPLTLRQTINRRKREIRNATLMQFNPSKRKYFPVKVEKKKQKKRKN